MRDYGELVKSLRICADSANPISECCFSDCCEHDEPIDPLCMGQLIHMAADAIEDLVVALTASNEVIAKSRDKWISVEERLPEEEKTVLVVRKFLSAKGVTVSVYVETAELIGGYWVSMSDEYKIIRYRHTDPIYWMPLPEPPKEET